LRIIHARSRRDGFSSAEGLIASPAAVSQFNERFGPRHLWSPSQWEAYAGCPYRFFLEGVLRLEPLGDLVLETDFARRGGRLHDVLAEFHRQWPAVREKGCASPDDEPAAFRAHLKSIIDRTIAAAPRTGIDAALLELDCRQIARWADDHFKHHNDYARQWPKIGGELAPAHFEFRFGPARPGDADNDSHSSDKPFELEINGETVLVTGRIDRIDVARIGERIVFNIIDYKSGRKPRLQEEHIASGEHLQLPIYVAAAQAILYDGAAQPLAAGYWSMTGGFDSKGVLAHHHDDADDRWTRIRTIVEQRVGELIAGIRQGDFPVISRDDKCTSYCDFSTVCRITQIRSLGKTWPPNETVV
jgi:ATP-dependent helicase/DNAse subunit B